MKKIIESIAFIILITIFMISCEPSIDNPKGTGNLGSLAVTADSLIYVAIGNSLTAGYQNGGVSPEGQFNSYPNLIARQIGLKNFVQPEVENPGIGSLMSFAGFDATGSPLITTTLSKANVTNLSYPKPYNNLGVPGAVLYDLLDTTDFAQKSQALQNPFYMAFLRTGQMGKSILDQAINLKPNLITIWMGNNDVLLYAISGGTVSTTVQNGKPVPTPSDKFLGIYQAGLTKLTMSLPNAKIILFTIPDVTGAAYFHTIPWNGLVLTDQSKVDALNLAYQQLGSLIRFHLGANGFVAKTLDGNLRQLTSDDDLLLQVPKDSLALYQMGSNPMIPIPKKYVLFMEEINLVKNTVKEYNGDINSLTAISPNIKIKDMNAVFNQILTSGYPVPGSTTVTANYISGELLSLDGIHPTARGYGLLANEILKFINQTYGSDIPFIEVQNLPAIKVSR